MSEQAANHAPLFWFARRLEAIRCEQVQHDVVIVASVKRDVFTAGLDHGSDYFDGLVTIERSDLDGHHVFDLDKTIPEGQGKDTTTGGRLKVESHQRDDLGYGCAMSD